MSNETRLKVVRFLGRQCTSEEELNALVKETQWEMKEHEWEEARACIVGDEQVLYGVPWLSAGLMVGRVEEIESLCAWLLDERRMVDQVLMMRGVGGVGKTMLAIHTVRQRIVWKWYRDGVFWVDVERYEEIGAIRRLAQMVVGGKALQAEDLWKAVAEALKGKRVLVVLDGVEGRIDLNRWGDLLPQKGRLLVTTRGTEVDGARVDVRVLELTGLASDAARELLTRAVRPCWPCG